MVATRILIADDHEMVRKGLRATLQTRKRWEVCGEAVNGREAVEKASKLNPDVVIMDITMPVLNGLEATRQIRKRLPRVQVLVLTIHESEQLMHEVLKAGARGYVAKSEAGSVILEAIQCLERGRPFFSSGMSELMLKAYLTSDEPGSPAPDPPEALTSREREIVQLIAEGKSSKEVAATLGISARTAETHRANLMRKLNLHSVSEIVRYAIRNRMVQA